MYSGLSNFCKEKMALHIAENFPCFSKTSLKLKGALVGSDVYAWKVDSSRTAWFIFGGYKKGDGDLIADIAWTLAGKKLTDIDYIDWWTVPEKFPEDGACKLVHMAVVGADYGESRAIELARPPKDLQELALQNYTKSELFLKTVQSRLQKLIKKNPALPYAEAEVLAVEDNMKGSRPFFQLWSSCAESIELSRQDLEAATHNAMVKAFYLLDKYGVKFLEDRLKCCS